MQIFVQHSVKDGLELPISYNHILQSIIYDALENGDLKESELHDKGWNYQRRQYRLFQFSGISGHYQIKGNRILFDQDISWEIRTIDPNIAKTIADSFINCGINYCGKQYPDISVSVRDKHVDKDELRIKMKTPICVYSTDIDTKKTIFYSPDQNNFSRYVNDNFKRKYAAYTGVSPERDITLLPEEIFASDKVVTRYKGFYLSGWKGNYLLKGEHTYLDFLFQTGIGSKNSQGFGMFDF